MTRKACPSLLAIRKAILPLNNALPTSISSIWSCPDKLHERLLFTRVCNSLSLNVVLDYLRLYNSGQAFMAKIKHSVCRIGVGNIEKKLMIMCHQDSGYK